MLHEEGTTMNEVGEDTGQRVTIGGTTRPDRSEGLEATASDESQFVSESEGGDSIPVASDRSGISGSTSFASSASDSCQPR